MKLPLSNSSIAIFLALALTACGGGGDSTPTFTSGSSPNLDCNSIAGGGGAGSSCIPGSGTGGTTPATTGPVIIATNYEFLANQISAQLDGLVRQRTGSPPTLAELGLLLLKKIQNNSVTVCAADATNPNPLNITPNGSGAGTTYTLDFSNCKFADKPANGSLTISNFIAHNNLTNNNEAWDAQASINISSLTYTLSTDLSLAFFGAVDISAVNDLTSIDTSLTLTNFSVSENNTGASTSNTDTYTTAELTSSEDSDYQRLNVSATINNTSVTQSTLNITSSVSPPLTWDKNSGSDNPTSGALIVSSSSDASNLTLSANGTSDTMTVTLDNSSVSACATWAGINPAACGP